VVGPMKVTGFDHTRICVSDIDRSRAFYEGILGMEVSRVPDRQSSEALDTIVGGHDVGVQLVFGRIGGHIVELIHFDNIEVHRSPAHPHLGNEGFTVTVDDIDEAFAIAAKAGVNATPAIVEVKGTRIFFVNDPDGARIECIQYADNHAVTWPHD
jgi:catechol 2,3-dioxygenase-like lactoylglutathione lyase family enzyme